MKTGRRTWKLTVELRSPMQIGAGSIGMVEKTELFIPGRVVWGALTSTITETCGSRTGAGDYIQVGRQLGPAAEEFGTFFPSFDRGASFWHPVQAERGIEWMQSPQTGAECRPRPGDFMEQRLMMCISSTAISSDRQAAQDETLHATDLISPVWASEEDGVIRRTCFTGIARLPERVMLNGSAIALGESDLMRLFDRCRFGGGRKRGWGAVRSVEAREMPSAEGPPSFLPMGDGSAVLLAPLLVSPSHGSVRGRCTLAVHREHCQKKGSGQGFSRPELVWQVGTVLPAEAIRSS